MADSGASSGGPQAGVWQGGPRLQVPQAMLAGRPGWQPARLHVLINRAGHPPGRRAMEWTTSELTHAVHGQCPGHPPPGPLVVRADRGREGTPSLHDPRALASANGESVPRMHL